MITFTELLERAKTKEIAIHTPTEAQAITLLTELDKRGYKWANGTKLTSETWCWVYKENTCYDFELNKQVSFSSLSFYQQIGFAIIEFNDIDFTEIIN
jgi:hypothetical protein